MNKDNMTKEEFESIGWTYVRSKYSPKFIDGNWNHSEQFEYSWVFTKEVDPIKLMLEFRLIRNEVNIYGKDPDNNWYFKGKVDNPADLQVIDRCIVTMLLFDFNAVNKQK